MKESSVPSTNQTAEKLLVVLEALAHQNQPVKLLDFARELGMNSSTLYRFLSALHNMGYVTQDETSGKYALNLKLCYLAELVKRNQSIVTILHDFVVEAGLLFQETAHLTQVENQHIVYVDNTIAGAQSLTIQQYIGKTAPMYCTGVGKLFLSEFTQAQLDDYLYHHQLVSLTPYTLATREALCQELEEVCRKQYAIDNEECELGVRCVAVPVRDYTGKIAAGLSVSGPATRITDEVIQAKLSQLQCIASRASSALGFTGSQNA